MKGTEKQIAWAEKIKEEIIETMKKFVDNANERVKRDTMPDFYGMICEIMMTKAIKNMEEKMEETGATYVIERRKSLPFLGQFHAAVEAAYESSRYDAERQQKIREMYRLMTQ